MVLVGSSPRLLPRGEHEVAAVVAAALQRRGVRLQLGAAVVSAQSQPGGVRVQLADGSTLAASCLFLATGRWPAMGVPPGAGAVAIGDLSGEPMEAANAELEGRWAAASLLAGSGPPPSRPDPEAIPTAVFCVPEVARVGWVGRGTAVCIADGGTLRAALLGETEGFTLLRTDASGRLRGASIVGPHAAERIQLLTLALHQRLPAAALAALPAASPTLGQAFSDWSG